MLMQFPHLRYLMAMDPSFLRAEFVTKGENGDTVFDSVRGLGSSARTRNFSHTICNSGVKGHPEEKRYKIKAEQIYVGLPPPSGYRHRKIRAGVT